MIYQWFVDHALFIGCTCLVLIGFVAGLTIRAIFPPRIDVEKVIEAIFDSADVMAHYNREGDGTIYFKGTIDIPELEHFLNA